jgi:hypothetical protein
MPATLQKGVVTLPLTLNASGRVLSPGRARWGQVGQASDQSDQHVCRQRRARAV